MHLRKRTPSTIVKISPLGGKEHGKLLWNSQAKVLFSTITLISLETHRDLVNGARSLKTRNLIPRLKLWVILLSTRSKRLQLLSSSKPSWWSNIPRCSLVTLVAVKPNLPKVFWRRLCKQNQRILHSNWSTSTIILIPPTFKDRLNRHSRKRLVVSTDLLEECSSFTL